MMAGLLHWKTGNLAAPRPLISGTITSLACVSLWARLQEG